MISQTIKQRIRRAVTLVEVIFAIGVILIGLLGLLSILPLAGKRSQDSISLSTGPQIANRVLAELKSHRFVSGQQLITLGGFNVPARPTSAICLDPLYASNPLAGQGSASSGSYNTNRFPFYESPYDPTSDPRLPSTGGSVSFARMFRVGLTGAGSSTSVGRLLSENRDDLINTKPDDRSLPVRLSDGEIRPGTGVVELEYGKRIPSGEFSWLVTVNPLPPFPPFPDPNELGTKLPVYASVAVVIIRNRTLEFDFPPPGGKYHVGERLAKVDSMQGFRGGAGGVVKLSGYAKVDSQLVAGDWIMLSKNESSGVTHHWYRVVGLDGEPEWSHGTELKSAQANGTWTHTVLLDGPDWNPTPDTCATLLSGVVCVTETVLKLSEI